MEIGSEMMGELEYMYISFNAYIKERGRILCIRDTIKKRVGIFVNVLCMISVSRTFLSISCFLMDQWKFNVLLYGPKKQNSLSFTIWFSMASSWTDRNSYSITWFLAVQIFLYVSLDWRIWVLAPWCIYLIIERGRLV